MNFNEITEWTNASTQAEETSLLTHLPKDSPAGSTFEELGEGVLRKWLRVQIIHGPNGARWAYWHPWLDISGRYGSGQHPQFHAVADNIFNGDAVHFIGMLAVPYTKIPGETPLAWVLTEPRMSEPSRPIVIEEKPRERYEKSKEVYDVQTRKTKRLP